MNTGLVDLLDSSLAPLRGQLVVLDLYEYYDNKNYPT